jgi:hypothetical protein
VTPPNTNAHHQKGTRRRRDGGADALNCRQPANATPATNPTQPPSREPHFNAKGRWTAPPKEECHPRSGAVKHEKDEEFIRNRGTNERNGQHVFGSHSLPFNSFNHLRIK